MILIGASGHAKVISDILFLSNVILNSYYDDKHIRMFNNLVVNTPINLIPEKTEAIIAIGDNVIRKRIAESNPTLNYKIAIHPTSVIDNSVSIGLGSVVMASSTINIATSIGSHCIINTSSSIDHDCILGDFVHISPGAILCGNVTISEGTHIGAGAVVCPNLKIGKWATVGAGAVIIHDIPNYAIVVGNPGKIIKYNEK
jgi:sugar O-acyltransferase (sialic acid O-acetyltransferase NeuD family)